MIQRNIIKVKIFKKIRFTNEVTVGDLLLIILIAISCHAVNKMDDYDCPKQCEVDHPHNFGNTHEYKEDDRK